MELLYVDYQSTANDNSVETQSRSCTKILRSIGSFIAQFVFPVLGLNLILAGSILVSLADSVRIGLITCGGILCLLGSLAFLFLVYRMLIAYFDNRDLIIAWLSCASHHHWEVPHTRHERLMLSRKNLYTIICALLLFTVPLIASLLTYGVLFRTTVYGLALLVTGSILGCFILCITPCCGIYIDELKRSKLVTASINVDRGHTFYDHVTNEYYDLPPPAPAYYRHKRDTQIEIAEDPPTYQ